MAYGLPAIPGVSDWIAPRRNMLAGLGAGLLNGNPGAGVIEGRQADDAYATMQKAETERQKAIADQTAMRSKYADWFTQQGRPDIAMGIADGAIDYQQAYWDQINPQKVAAQAPPASVQEYEFARQNGYAGSFADWMQTGKNGAAGPQLGMTPQWAQDPATGKWVLGQMSSDGRFQPTDMGGLQPMDPLTAAGGKAGAVVDGKTAAAARAALPGAEQALVITRDAIDTLRNNTAGMGEQFGKIAGVIPQQMLPTIPGTERANFQVQLEQASGQAFMQARAMLKGGGQITDYEGRRGEAAYSRMQAAAEKGDQQAFLEALDDFEKAVEDGYKKLQEVAGGSYAPALTPNMPAPAQPTSTGVQWSYEP